MQSRRAELVGFTTFLLADIHEVDSQLATASFLLYFNLKNNKKKQVVINSFYKIPYEEEIICNNYLNNIYIYIVMF